MSFVWLKLDFKIGSFTIFIQQNDIKQRNNTSFKIMKTKQKIGQKIVLCEHYDLRETMLLNRFKIGLVVMLCKVSLFVS